MKLLVVLGYSNGAASGLHPICSARLARAFELSADADAVVLSGRPEAELMRRAWRGAERPLICESRARITAENAAHVAVLARELGAGEVVVVTSWWHRPRAWFLFRLLLRGVRVRTAPVWSPWSVRLLMRELGCMPLVPLQLALVRRREPRSLDQERGRKDGETPGEQVGVVADVDSDPREDEDDDGGEHEHRPGSPGKRGSCHGERSSTPRDGRL